LLERDRHSASVMIHRRARNDCSWIGDGFSRMRKHQTDWIWSEFGDINNARPTESDRIATSIGPETDG
jgi:hypothetical protein